MGTIIHCIWEIIVCDVWLAILLDHESGLDRYQSCVASSNWNEIRKFPVVHSLMRDVQYCTCTPTSRLLLAHSTSATLEHGRNIKWFCSIPWSFCTNIGTILCLQSRQRWDLRICATMDFRNFVTYMVRFCFWTTLYIICKLLHIITENKECKLYSSRAQLDLPPLLQSGYCDQAGSLYPTRNVKSVV